MSAYMVDREHIAYLIQAARHYEPSGFRWYHGGAWKILDHENESEVGQMLWDENRASIEARYPDCIGHPENMPGPCDESFVYEHRRLYAAPFDVAQVFKSCRCYEYQACEHDGWEESSARAFVRELERAAMCEAPGYEEAEWGAPCAQAVRP